MAVNLNDDQRYRIAISLVTAMIGGFREDTEPPNEGEGSERSILRLFAYSFACGHTAIAEGAEEAHALCEKLFETYYGLLDFSTERLQRHDEEIRERFARYYRATDWIGKASKKNVPFDLSSISGAIPLEAFVALEIAFWSFAEPERELSIEDFRIMAREPMKSTFGQFLGMWNEAEELIQRACSATI